MSNSPLRSSAVRITSVDALRGLIILAMVFGNDIGGVHAAPDWLRHHAPEFSGMTFADVVFGSFLFIVGVSLPLAIESRRRRGQSWGAILLHIALRTASLLLLGVFMVNMPAKASVMGWPQDLWEALVFTAGIVAFADVPRDLTRSARSAWWIARIGAFVGLAYLAWVYRGPEGRWLHTSWWGILGLIGWAYLVASLVYVLLRRFKPALLVAAAALMGLYALDQRGAFDGWWIRSYLWIGVVLGSHAALTVTGVGLGAVLLAESRFRPVTARLLFCLMFGAALALAAILLQPVYGIHKEMATPSWAFWCAAITCWLWGVTYVVADVWRWKAVSWLLVLAGINALLIYILQPLFMSLVMLLGVDFYLNLGAGPLWLGLTRSAGLAVLLTLLAGVLNRAGVRMRL